MYLAGSFEATLLNPLLFGNNLLFISKDSSAFFMMKLFCMLTLVGELKPSLLPPTVSSFFVALGEAILFFYGERFGL